MKGQTMTAKLIGFPHAGERWNYGGHVADLAAEQAEADAKRTARARARAVRLVPMGWTDGAGAAGPRRTDWGVLPPGLDDLGQRSGGDITGAKGSKAKRARAVGAGEDPDVQRAQEVAEWAGARALADRALELAPMGADVALMTAGQWAELMHVEQAIRDAQAERAALLADLTAERDEGQRVLTLAGGAGWGDGRRVVTLNSGGMAARAARYIKRLRGAEPSETSLQEAAATAAAAIWFEWCCYSALCGNDWTDCAEHHLATVGWRAAFRSLTRDAADGMTGRHAGQDSTHAANSVSTDSSPAQLQIERDSLEAWARDRQGRVFEHGDQPEARARRARRGVLAWFARILQVKAKGRTGEAERARFSVLARLIHGRDIATAARGAGFASGRAAVESFRSGRVWARLRAAVAAHKGASERMLLAARVRAVRAAMEAIKAQRAARAGAGRIDRAPILRASVRQRRPWRARASSLIQPGGAWSCAGWRGAARCIPWRGHGLRRLPGAGKRWPWRGRRGLLLRRRGGRGSNNLMRQPRGCAPAGCASQQSLHTGAWLRPCALFVVRKSARRALLL
jgi:hypothetical protein